MSAHGPKQTSTPLVRHVRFGPTTELALARGILPQVSPLSGHSDGKLVRDSELAGWSARSTSYDHYLSPITNQVTVPIISVLGPLGGKRVLDVCCGPGHLAGAMAAAGADVEGIDFAATMVTNARDNYPNLGFREGDAEALPYPDGAFDHVVCAFGVMHIGHPDAAMAEASRVFAARGSICIHAMGHGR